MILILLFLAVTSCFLIFRGFTLATVWIVEGGWYRMIDGYELWWESIRGFVLPAVGICILAWFILLAITNFLLRVFPSDQITEGKNGHR